MIQRLFFRNSLLNQIIFSIHHKPRDPNIPTHAPIINPFKINFIQNNPGYRRYAKEVGRGPGSGKGKTCGRGMKGQNSRSGGGVPVTFEGGQTPIQRRLPKFGRGSKRKLNDYLQYINLEKIQYYVRLGILDKNKTITQKDLHDAQIVKDMKYGVKLLGRGADIFEEKINIQVTDASKIAISKIKQFGGQVKLVYRSPAKLRQHLYPQKHPVPVQQPIPQLYMIKRIDMIQKDRGVKVQYRKPKWKIQQEASLKQVQTFKFPVSRAPDPTKIHKRKPKLWRKITLDL